MFSCSMRNVGNRNKTVRENSRVIKLKNLILNLINHHNREHVYVSKPEVQVRIHLVPQFMVFYAL